MTAQNSPNPESTKPTETVKEKRTRLENLIARKQQIEQDIEHRNKQIEQEAEVKKQKFAESVKAKKDQIEAQLQSIENTRASATRKLDTNRKILMGATLENLVKTGKMSEAELLEALDSYLTTQRDRSVFGLKGGTRAKTQAAQGDEQAADQTDDKTSLA